MTAVDVWDGTDGADDGGEIEDFTRIPYPDAWNRDPEDGTDGTSGLEVDGDGFARELLDAANAWYRVVELLIDQGFAPEDCEAEVVRRCAKVSRGQRALMRGIAQEEAEYGQLAADESACDFPWGRLCPEHGKTLREGRRGCYCAYEGCERRWPVGYSRGHCDQPAAVLVVSAFKNGEWRLCAEHRRLHPAGRTPRTFQASALMVAGPPDAASPAVESDSDRRDG
ncbi:hypothetical protein [Actinokineospora iranica]|uniref:Uncharacterized protein n=1 Tax=Actinokineospora iranica TaxID=1271860 RepID=A0A1G6JPB7_9PSEU|nr:hypothetical protein [Actinokineospora iranica]SDC20511.1 hypothetical protein SAMN05216174_101498 [Actinokineospora iranica]